MAKLYIFPQLGHSHLRMHIYVIDYVPFPLLLTQSFLYITEFKQRSEQEIHLSLHRSETTGRVYLLW